MSHGVGVEKKHNTRAELEFDVLFFIYFISTKYHQG